MPRSRWFVAFVGLVGCADILGIGNVPEPVTGDAGLDAPFDSLVVPDGPFEGCNGGAEDCSNGIDDNCNGLVDCEDPVCQGATYQCVDRAPSGWTLVAFASGSGETIPAGCSGAYAQSTAQGHAGLTAPAAQCGCTCPLGTATGTTCPAITVSGYAGGTSCNSGVDQTLAVSGSCMDFNQPQGSILPSEGAPTALGSCGNPTPSKTLPAVQWANSYAACGYSAPDDQGGCTTSSQCVKLPSSAFEAAPCVAQSGDVACPGTPYTKKTLVMQSVDEKRDCTACACTATGGSCSATLTAYLGGGCSSTSVAVPVNGQCGAEGDSVMSVNGTVTTTLATCVMSGGAPTGAAAATNPVTVCCP